MFLANEIAKKMTLQRQKLAYTVVFGLASHFKSKLLTDIISSSNFVVSFDESLNKISQKLHVTMDIIIRLWDQEKEQVSIRYLTSAFLTSSKTVDSLDSFKTTLRDVKLNNMN